MKNEELLLSAMGNMEDDYLMEAMNYQKKTHRFKKRTIAIIAAAAAVLSISAIAATLSFRQAARADLGISEANVIAEYTEYEPNEVEAAPQEVPPKWSSGEKIALISTLCSGDRMTAFLEVHGVTEEMEAPLESGTDIWDIGSMENANSFDATQVSYNAEAETALVRAELLGVTGDHVVLQLAYRVCDSEGQTPGGVLYGPIDIPVTDTRALHAELLCPISGCGIEAELQCIDVSAGNVRVLLNTAPAEGGDPDTTDKFLTQLDELMNNPDSVMANAELNLADGTSLRLAEQERIYAAVWALDSRTDLETDEWNFDCQLVKALNLSEIVSITIGGETYPLTA